MEVRVVAAAAAIGAAPEAEDPQATRIGGMAVPDEPRPAGRAPRAGCGPSRGRPSPRAEPPPAPSRRRRPAPEPPASGRPPSPRPSRRRLPSRPAPAGRRPAAAEAEGATQMRPGARQAPATSRRPTRAPPRCARFRARPTSRPTRARRRCVRCPTGFDQPGDMTQAPPPGGGLGAPGDMTQAPPPGGGATAALSRTLARRRWRLPPPAASAASGRFRRTASAAPRRSVAARRPRRPAVGPRARLRPPPARATPRRRRARPATTASRRPAGCARRLRAPQGPIPLATRWSSGCSATSSRSTPLLVPPLEQGDRDLVGRADRLQRDVDPAGAHARRVHHRAAVRGHRQLLGRIREARRMAGLPQDVGFWGFFGRSLLLLLRLQVGPGQVQRDRHEPPQYWRGGETTWLT